LKNTENILFITRGNVTSRIGLCWNIIPLAGQARCSEKLDVEVQKK